MKRAREGKSKPGIDILREKMLSRTNRIQGQITFQNGYTGLGMLVGQYGDKTYCTWAISAWLCAIIHPEHGLSKYKVPMKHYNSIPMYAPAPLMARLNKGPNVQLQTELSIIYHVMTDPESLLAKQYPEHVKLAQQYWSGEMILKEAPKVFVSHVCACYGAMVFYHGFHFNVSCHDPTIVMHLDYLPFAPSQEADQVLEKVFNERSCKSYNIHPGKSNEPIVENELYNATKLPPLPNDELSETALGKRSWREYIKSHPKYLPELWNHNLTACLKEHRQELYDRGYTVFHPKFYWTIDDRTVDYNILVDRALKEFEGFFNYALFERVGRSERLSFDDRSDKLWSILRGQKECEAIIGNKHFMNLATKCDDGKWHHPIITQGGNGNVTIMCGMGHATNFYRGEHSLRLSCHEFVITVFQHLYNHVSVHNCCERWRVKCGVDKPDAGNHNVDHHPKYNMMPIHIDIKPFASHDITPISFCSE